MTSNRKKKLANFNEMWKPHIEKDKENISGNQIKQVNFMQEKYILQASTNKMVIEAMENDRFAAAKEPYHTRSQDTYSIASP